MLAAVLCLAYDPISVLDPAAFEQEVLYINGYRVFPFFVILDEFDIPLEMV